MQNKNVSIWKIDPTHSEVSFKVKHMMISTVTGNFEKFDAQTESADDDFQNAKFKFSAETASVNTNNQDRDNHLKSDDFFGAEAHPELTFTSKSFDGEMMVGDLTIKGVTKTIELDAEYNGTVVDPYGQTKAGFEFEGQISRKDFGLNWNTVTEAGGIVVSDKVRMIVSLQFVKQ